MRSYQQAIKKMWIWAENQTKSWENFSELERKDELIEITKQKIKSIKHMHKENFDVLKIFDITID